MPPGVEFTWEDDPRSQTPRNGAFHNPMPGGILGGWVGDAKQQEAEIRKLWGGYKNGERL
jgi:hypothetical protein